MKRSIVVVCLAVFIMAVGSAAFAAEFGTKAEAEAAEAAAHD